MKDITNYIRKSSAALLVLLVFCQWGFSNAGIGVRLLGTAAPPLTVSGYPMAAFQEARPDFTNLNSIAAPSCGNALTTNITLNKRTVPSSWASSQLLPLQ